MTILRPLAFYSQAARYVRGDHFGAAAIAAPDPHLAAGDARPAGGREASDGRIRAQVRGLQRALAVNTVNTHRLAGFWPEMTHACIIVSKRFETL